MIKEKVKKIYENLSVNKWGHVKRVLNFATKLGKDLNLNDRELEMIQVSALIHDVGYKKQFEKGGEDIHEKFSAEMVDEVLVDSSFDEKEISIIKENVLTHGSFEDCKTKMQKILYDADKLEKTTVGEIIRKSIIMHGKFNMGDEQIFWRLFEKMKEKKFHFKESREIAQENLDKIFVSFNNYKNLLNDSNETERKFDI